MVDRKKRSKLAKPPASKPPNLDAWVAEGGTDPEIVQKPPSKVEESKTSTEEQEEDNKKAYPHRISFDMASPQYKRLKWASFDTEQSMNHILREAVEEWMKARDY